MPTAPTSVLRSNTFEEWRVKTNTISSDLGNKVDLAAAIVDTTTLVAVANELQGQIGLSVADPLSGHFTATTLRGAVNELRDSAITFYGAKTFNAAVTASTTLAVVGNFSVNTDKFTVNSSSGNALIAGTLDVTGNATFSSGLTMGGSGTFAAPNISISGNTTLGDSAADATLVNGALTVKGADFKVQNSSAVNKFTVDDATGNTVISGNLQVLGDTSITGATSLNVDFGDLLNLPDPQINLALSGDVTGSASVTLSQLGAGPFSLAVTTSIQPNSVALGTDTTGNYVATAAAGTGISVSGSGSETAAVTITNTGVTSNVAGVGISLSGTTGASTITNSDKGSDQVIFKTIAVAGQSDIIADNNDDTLTLAAGQIDATSGITITTDAGTDTITITHANSSTLSGAQGIQGIASVTVDTYGHVTGVTSASTSPISVQSLYVGASQVIDSSGVWVGSNSGLQGTQGTQGRQGIQGINGLGINYLVKTSNYTMATLEGILADTSGGAFTVTLPASPATGNQCNVADHSGTWGTNNLTVARNGSTIGGIAADLACDISGISVQLIYNGSTWDVYAQVGTSATQGTQGIQGTQGTQGIQGITGIITGIPYSVKTANYTLVNTEGILANTTVSTFTINLPASPVTGEQYYIADHSGTWGTNNLTVGRNGNTINGLAENLILDISGVSVQFIYNGTTWDVYAQVGGNTNTGFTTLGGILSSSATAGIGYATGAGNTITQASDRTTGVTINNITGAITLVSDAGATSWQSFTVTNSAVAATDAVMVHQKSGTDLYEIHVTAVSLGSFVISYRTTSGTTTEQPVFTFAVIKSVTS